MYNGAHDTEGCFRRVCLVTERLPNPSCVLKVGKGRGFIIEQVVKFYRPERTVVKRRVVVTAAHCLRKLPPAHGPNYEKRNEKLLRSLDGGKTRVSVECLFVDPVADIAVLGCPDDQELGDEAKAYHELTDNVPVLRIGDARSGRGWVLSLDGHWVRTTLEVSSGPEGMVLSIDPTEDGTSGSPVLNDAGRAVGVVVVGPKTASTADGERRNERAGPQPMLMRNLPGWLLQFQR
jgi:Trypsin-like peptidase domain